MMSPNNGKQVRDTTYTKIFVGGLAWETNNDTLQHYFEQFGEILEAVVITDRNTSRSKGFGFVNFKDSDSAIRACQNPYPVIDGRKVNCNLAAFGAQKPKRSNTGREKFSSTSWAMVPISFQGPSTYYNQLITHYTIPYSAYRYPGYLPPRETYLMNYYNAYGGQQLPSRMSPEFYNPNYGFRYIPLAFPVKKAQYQVMPPQELYTIVGFSEPTSASPSISNSGSVS